MQTKQWKEQTFDFNGHGIKPYIHKW